MRREDLARVAHAILSIDDRRDGAVEIERARVIDDVVAMRHVEQEVAERQEAFAVWTLHPVGDAVGTVIVAGEHRLAHRWQGRARSRVIAIVTTSRPQGVLIQRDDVLTNAAAHHRADPTIADG